LRYKPLVLLLPAYLLLIPSLALAWLGKIEYVTDGDTIVEIKHRTQADMHFYEIDTLGERPFFFVFSEEISSITRSTNDK